MALLLRTQGPGVWFSQRSQEIFFSLWCWDLLTAFRCLVSGLWRRLIVDLTHLVLLDSTTKKLIHTNIYAPTQRHKRTHFNRTRHFKFISFILVPTQTSECSWSRSNFNLILLPLILIIGNQIGCATYFKLGEIKKRAGHKFPTSDGHNRSNLRENEPAENLRLVLIKSLASDLTSLI